MKKVRNIIAAATMSAMLLFGTTFANAGIIVAGLTDKPETDPCTVTGEKVDSGIIVTDLDGIIVAGLTGIIVAGYTGIIVAGVKQDTTPVNCGIIVAG